MSKVSSFLRLLSTQHVLRGKTDYVARINTNYIRSYADKPKSDVKAKQIMVQGTENENKLRVRLARPADGPRILKFVRNNAPSCWYGMTPSSATLVILNDYVSRALAQGHSLLAENQDNRRGSTQIRALALAMATSPWDAMLLEKWARCVRCPVSRDLMIFTAHCLKGPALHEKYGVNKILQVELVLPPEEVPQRREFINVLAKKIAKLAKQSGIPLIRFNVGNDDIAQCLQNLNYKKEWQMSLDMVPETIQRQGIQKENALNTAETTKQTGDVKLANTTTTEKSMKQPGKTKSKNLITVYTGLTKNTV